MYPYYVIRAYLRHPVSGERDGREDTFRYAGPCVGGDYAGHLYPHHRCDADGSEAALGSDAGIVPPDQLTGKQKQIWEYMKFRPKETNLNAIAKGAEVNRHTAAKYYELIWEMVGHG